MMEQDKIDRIIRDLNKGKAEVTLAELEELIAHLTRQKGVSNP